MSTGSLSRKAAQPVAFADTIGLYTPAETAGQPARLAVLFASPWGLEEMSIRKLWRVTADRLADHGIPSMRFDYPATGDALDTADFSGGLAVWSKSLVAAAQQLKILSGCGRIAVIAEGLGCVIATKAAADLDGLEAMAFLAPVVSGRLHLRELAIWSSIVDDSLGLAPHQRDRSGAVSIASLQMPAEIAAELRRVNLMMIDQAPAGRMLVASRPEIAADSDFSRRLRTVGADVTECRFDGYQSLIANPTVSRLPEQAIDEIVSWTASLPVAPQSSPPRQMAAPGELRGPHFIETPLCFGRADGLLGVLCEPIGRRQSAAALFVSSAYDRHAGWGRQTAAMARELARAGIASLRFDTANVADSPDQPGRPEQVLYHDSQIEDVSDAIDLLQSRNFARILVAGRCSGAYLAFRSALADDRICGVIAVNPIVFRWQPGRSVDDAIVNGTRSLEDYGRRALDLATLKRLRAGQIDVVAAAVNIAGGIGRRIGRGLSHTVRFALPEGREIRHAFETLHRRNVPVSLIYSDGDIGLEHYSYYFGRNGRSHAQWPDVAATIIAEADHNLTPPEARKVYVDSVRDMALRLGTPVMALEGKRTAAE
jgi:alpha-beta hydrolase superfamily lysophospholipase